ncbi:hypothetical protein TUMSATVNIG1_59770 (plasmid) [Vibrio nigripulchritudo]|uniref:hypothetical protein n=1 Tax=Vibrio nigripulchritudo TaxID=28173 RepID=UPI00190C9F12|nr:hypothetical protein [Vibrio nigripulchritudo]BCL73991.1 hypothetical protein VNTUMSATTG_59280 [Vibrio nigripulchritudo]BDU35368.1 hypothetical protein TUMSATVNIG1_59770 [Vibrio nigripulchritudo]
MSKYKELKTVPPAIEKMATESGLSLTTVSNVIPPLIKDILRTWHTAGAKTGIDERVEQAWEKLFNYQFNNSSESVVPMYFKGPPGQGKSTAFRVACKMIAKAMGVELFTDPTVSDRPSRMDIVFVEAQLGGAISITPIVGIPSKSEDAHSLGTSVYLPPARMKRLAEQDFALIVLDDIDNANEMVKNGLMPVIYDKKVGDYNLGKNTYTGATGNLGVSDGTNISKGSSALYNRTRVVLIHDTLGDFLERAEEKYNDNLGLCHLDEFLISSPSKFYPERDRKQRGPTPTSRSYDGLLSSLRNLFSDYESQIAAGLNPQPLYPQIADVIPSHVGRAVADEMSLFYRNIMTLAYPASKEATSKNGLSDVMMKKLSETFSQVSAESEMVARAYMKIVSNHFERVLFDAITAEKPKKEEILENMEKFSEAMFGVGLIKGGKTNILAQQFINFAKGLISRSDSLSRTQLESKTFKFGHLNDSGYPILDDGFLKQLVKVTMDNESASESKFVVGKGSDGNNILAIQSALIDPLTHSVDAIEMQMQ